MPLYEYECKQCKRHTEKIQKFSDPEITECPHCGGPLERVISAPAISFKGGGWYRGRLRQCQADQADGESKSDCQGGFKGSSARRHLRSSSKDSTSAPAAPMAASALQRRARGTASSSTSSSDKK